MTEQEFIQELSKINITPTELQLKQLEKYYELLIEWNKVMNLTGITEKDQVYLKHFYDSATLASAIDLNNEKSLCDVGTGAGFPGIVIKILFPNLKVVLIDSLQKRINFLNQVIQELDLKNIEVYHARAEEFAQNHREEFDVVTARAVASLPVLLEYCVPLVKVGKYFIPMKASIEEEMVLSSKAIQILKVEIESLEKFELPFEKSLRSILKLKKVEETSKKYPRKYSEIKKRPL